MPSTPIASKTKKGAPKIAPPSNNKAVEQGDQREPQILDVGLPPLAVALVQIWNACQPRQPVYATEGSSRNNASA